jgi:hypothetical protein
MNPATIVLIDDIALSSRMKAHNTLGEAAFNFTGTSRKYQLLMFSSTLNPIYVYCILAIRSLTKMNTK